MILENTKDEIKKKINIAIRTTDVTTKSTAFINHSATSNLLKCDTKQGIWNAENIFPNFNAVFSSISE